MKPCAECAADTDRPRKGLCSACYQRSRYRAIAMIRRSPGAIPDDGCPVTLWRGGARQCREPIDRDGLCARHADDRDKLAAS